MCVCDGDLCLVSGDADKLIQGVQDERSKGEVVHEGRLDEVAGTVEEHEDEVDHPEVVGQPKELEYPTTGILQSEGVDHCGNDHQKNTSET